VAALSGARRETFRALVTATGAGWTRAEADAAVARFAAAHGARFPEAREHVDRVLDAVERLPEGGSFRALPRSERRALLAFAAGDPAARVPRRDLVHAALELAAAPFGSTLRDPRPAAAVL
jgi:hypothetical protein